MPVYEMKTVEGQLDETLLTDRLIAMLSAGFGLLATLLASIGLYGVMAFVVARRRKELGIRLALGAQPGFVIWLVMREVLLLLAIGLAIGIPAAMALGRYVAVAALRHPGARSAHRRLDGGAADARLGGRRPDPRAARQPHRSDPGAAARIATRSSPLAEERLHEVAALVRSNVADDVEPMIVPGQLAALDGRRHRARPRFERAEHERPDARVDQRPDAHQAGLDRDVQGRAGQAIVADAACGIANRDDLRVRGRVLRRDRLIEPASDDFLVHDDDGADRHLAGVTGAARLSESGGHHLVMRRHLD